MQLVTYAFYFHKINNLLTLMKFHTNTVEGWVSYNEKNQSTFSRIVFFTLYVKVGPGIQHSSNIRVLFHSSHLMFKNSSFSTSYSYSYRQWYYQYFTRIYKEMLHPAGKTWSNDLSDWVQETQSNLSQGNKYTYVQDGTSLKISREIQKM